jgi:hypothetical protein
MSKNTNLKHVKQGLLTVSLHGGIGNQLFQYAFARAYSHHTSMHIIFDNYGFKFDKKFKRNFELYHFNIPLNIEIKYNFFLFHLTRILRRTGRFGKHIISFLGIPVLIESLLTGEVLNLKYSSLDNLYIFGYWQDEEYFKNCEAQIRRDLTFCPRLSNENIRIAEHIYKSHNSVSVHVRRLHQVGANETQTPDISSLINGESLLPEYYECAIDIMITKFPNATFFIFSDYPDWAKANITIKAESFFLEYGRGSDIEDLYLMSICKHHIIANSSFSWWGAWLGNAQNQIVIAPKAAPLMPKIPDRWIVI